ncbi:YadA-like family protein [Veillonella sp. 3310]|jgi:hypothetical protein|uniref:YadA-like family protein n=1 Tax=Veillonella sp. 3310 TaxID=2490956 RepID=UPI000FD6A671|nr:YadA-like family protein [Veillonella sp. 3310]
MLKTTGKKQTLKAAVLSAVMVMSAIGMNVADAALNEAGTGADNNVAFGAGSNAGGKNSTVIGPNANTNGENAIAIGTGASAGSTGTQAQSGVAIGGSANAKSNRAVAVGDSAQASWYGTALGSRSIAAANSVAIGGGGSADQSYAVASLGNSVALGSFARTTAGVATKDASVTSDDTTLKLTNFAGDKLAKGTGFVLSVGDKGKERQIQHVAAGQVTADSTDAMNGSQLYSTLATLANVAGSVKNIVGGDAKVDENGKITVTNIGGTGKATISDAIKAGKTEVAEGKNVTVTKDEGTDGQAIYKVAVKDDITLNSVTTGTTKMDANGLSIGDKNYVSVAGLNANDQAIKNVGAGKVAAGSKDAVNGDQLHKVEEKVNKVKNTAESLKTALGGNATIEDDGSVKVTDIGGTGKDTVDAAIKAVKTEVKAGDNVTVTPSTNGKDGHPIYTVAVNKDLTVDTVTTGATKVDTNGITIDNKQFVTKDGINANDTKVTNVADGKVSKDSKDAVNGSQLYTVKENIESTINQKLGDINTATTNINSKIDGINQNMNALENRVNSRMDKAVAGSAALAALHPLEFDGNDTWSIAAGYGNYHSGNALALGAFYRPNEDTMVSLGGTVGNGEKLFNVGVSLKVGQRGHIPMTKVAMAKEIDTLKAQLEDQNQKIAMLMNTMTSMQQGK